MARKALRKGRMTWIMRENTGLQRASCGYLQLLLKTASTIHLAVASMFTLER
jgi:hypothetical protein